MLRLSLTKWGLNTRLIKVEYGRKAGVDAITAYFEKVEAPGSNHGRAMNR
jgi:hypothetical protein